jgi:hypothetical protein
MEIRVSYIPTASRGARLRLAALSLALVPALLLTACGSDPAAPSTSTSFDGVIASGSLSGSLSFTVAATALDVQSAPSAATAAGPSFAVGDVTVTGSLTLDGSPAISLSGTYNTSTHALSLTGGGYTFTGTYADGHLDGTFTSPTESGTFSVQPSAGATIRNYCGTYGGNTDHGTFNIAVNTTAGTLSGAWASGVNGSSGGLSGTASGNAITITVSGSTTMVTGTMTSTSVSGSYPATADSDAGTISGSICS